MKNRWFLLLSLLLIVSFVTGFTMIYIPPEVLDQWNEKRKDLESSGLEASAPRILSTPADGSVFHGERNVTPGYGQVVSEVWTPTKPQDYYHVRIGINAEGYGEVAYTLNGNTDNDDIGNWRSEPLTKGDGPFTYRKRYNTNIINEARRGFTDEISPVTVNVPATGSALTRSRSIVTYGSRQAALSAQMTATGPNIGFVIGHSSFWKWEAGIVRDVAASDYNGEYHVTINDTNIAPGSGSGGMPPSGSTSPSDNTPNCPDCTSHCSSPCLCSNSGTCNGTVSYHACGEHETTVSGDHSLQASCSLTDANGNSCTVTNFYACQSHTCVFPAPPPPPPTVSCGRSGCSESVSSANEHRVGPCSACGGSYWSCSGSASYWENEHRLRTCRRSGCGNTWQRCISSTPRCNVASGQGCWAADP